jgi:adenosylhomocysteinase
MERLQARPAQMQPVPRRNDEFERAADFFRDVVDCMSLTEKPAAIVVAHVVSAEPVFLRALSQLTQVAGIIPKPRSINAVAEQSWRREFPIVPLTRTDLMQRCIGRQLDQYVDKKRVVLLDIGGYFSYRIADLADYFGSRLIGIVEDTENGHQKYERLDTLPCPIIAVARSPLKNSAKPGKRPKARRWRPGP